MQVKEENQSLRYQFGTLKGGEHSKYLPMVFTEQEVTMLSGALRSKRAVQVNNEISVFGRHSKEADCKADQGGIWKRRY
jgi:hypothetical protein